MTLTPLAMPYMVAADIEGIVGPAARVTSEVAASLYAEASASSLFPRPSLAQMKTAPAQVESRFLQVLPARR